MTGVLRSVAAGALSVTVWASSVPNAFAPVSSVRGVEVAQRDRQRYAGSLVSFNRAEAPGKLLSAAIRRLRRILERDARGECIGQTHVMTGDDCSL